MVSKHRFFSLSQVQAELAREAELAKEAEAAKQAELAKKAKQGTDCS